MSLPDKLKIFFDELAFSPDAQKAARADNYRFEQRISSQRWQEFNNIVDVENLMNVKRYLSDKIYVTGRSIPDTFLKINSSAWKEGLSEHTQLIRVENLSRLLSTISFEKLEELFQKTQAKHSESIATLTETLSNWNRDNRPAFAAFYDDVREECEDTDWPHALQKRLGLSHLGDDGPVPVALMRYSLKEVFAAQKKRRIPVACALPTVFEAPNSDVFFPTPAAYPFGATLSLDPDKAGILTPEILHCRIDYTPEHLFKLGFVGRSCAVKDDALRKVRDQHLFALRKASQQHDFGEAMVGRIC